MPQKKTIKIPHINLLPKDPFFETLIGKIMVWAIHVGRYIIVFTEIIVIMSFASRFKLDRDLTDLTARITQKQAIIQSFGDVEERTRSLQRKIGFADALLKENEAVIYLDHVIRIVPSDVQLTQLSVRPEDVTIAATTKTSNGIALFLNALQSDPLFPSVSVDRITSGDSKDPSITFTVRVLTGKQKAQPVSIDQSTPPVEGATEAQ